MDLAIAATLTTRWLGQIEPSIRQVFLNAGRLRHFGDGGMIFGFEQKQHCLWGIVSGTVRLFVAMSEQDPRLAHCAGPGFWFGAAPVITGGNRALQAVACGEVRVCAVDRAVVLQMAAKNGDVWRSVATLSILNEMIAIGSAEDLMIRAPAKRLVATLLRLAGWRHGYQGAPPVAVVPMTQLELAEASCLSRSSAAVILKGLVRKGLVKTEYRSITILDPAALTELLGA